MQPAGEVGQKLLLAFEGKEGPSPQIARALQELRPGGITLFRSLNIDHPEQVRALTAALQRLAGELELPPLLIAADQEGGQLMAIGDGTPLPGNMALGAAGSVELARRAGEVLGCELAALGINVNYAPCMDVNVNPHNPVVGVRSFGEDPALVARLGAAMIAGIQSQGVAATAKHFPGHGDTATDSHRGLPVVPHGLERLRSMELIPFRAARRAKLIMTAHIGLPALDGPDPPPATLSPGVLQGLLRRELRFAGVIITDALDMHAIQQGEALGGEALRAVQAGADLLLVTSNPIDQFRVHAALQAGPLNAGMLRASLRRISKLKNWIARRPKRPDLSVIASPRHLQAADEIAQASITLVRDDIALLPLRLAPDERVAVILPRPRDLTPADTSSYVAPRLANALREYQPDVAELLIPYDPQPADVGALLQTLQDYDLIVVGTLNAFEQQGQAALVRALLGAHPRTIVAALRLPYDLAAFPEAPCYLCTYSLLEPSMRALAAVIFGEATPRGHLPVSIPGLYAAGAGLHR